MSVMSTAAAEGMSSENAEARTLVPDPEMQESLQQVVRYIQWQSLNSACENRIGCAKICALGLMQYIFLWVLLL